MKVLIVSDFLDNIWWIETYIRNLGKVILNAKYDVEYFGMQNVKSCKKFYWLVKSFWNVSFARLFEDKLDEYKPDVIWFHSVSRFLWPKVIEKLEGFDGLVFMSYHDLWYFHLFASEVYFEHQIPSHFKFRDFMRSTKKWWLVFPYSVLKFWKLKKIRKLLNKYVDLHIVPSSFMTHFVQSQWYWERVKVLPHFVFDSDISNRINKFQDKVNLISFGRIESEKWWSILFYWLAEIFEKKYVDNWKYEMIVWKIRFFVFGKGSKTNELLDTFKDYVVDYSQNTIIDYDVLDQDIGEKFIYYFGHRDNNLIKKFLAISHINLVPSLFIETFWLSALEGMSMWVPALGFHKWNFKELLLKNYRILSDWHEPQAYVRKLNRLIQTFKYEDWLEDSKACIEKIKPNVIQTKTVKS